MLRSRRFNPGRVNAVRPRIGIHEDRCRVRNPDGLSSCEECIRRGHAFIAAIDSQGQECEPQGIRAVGHAHCIFQPVLVCEFLLEALEHRAHHVLAALENPLDVAINLFFDCAGDELDAAAAPHVVSSSAS